MLATKKSRLFVIFLFTAAAFLRLWGLGNFDISPDEHHFIHEAYRFVTGDPYVVPRHHPFRHGVPFVGHPFLGGDLMIIMFKVFGPSVTTGRLVMALSNLIAVLGTYILGKILFGPRVALTALLLLVFLPHDVRYGRDAHLDPLLEATLLFAAISFWKVLNSQKLILGLWLGAASALVWAAKINGPFLFVFYGLALAAFTRIKNFPLWAKNHWQQLIIASVSFVIIFYLLVSPNAYFDALANPADPDIAGINKVLSQFVRDFYSFMFQRLIPHLYSFPFALLVPFGIYVSLKHRKPQHLFLLSLFLVYSHIFITHVGHSGEYGYVTLNPYFSLFAALALSRLHSPLRKIYIFTVLIFFTPLLILNGLRINIGPWAQTTMFNDSNFRYGQTTYRDAVKAINNLPESPKVLWIKNGDRNVPMMDIRSGVELWPFFELDTVDTVLLANPLFKDELVASGNFRQYQELSYKDKDNLWILRRESRGK